MVTYFTQKNIDKLCQIWLPSVRNVVAKILVNFSTGILFKFVLLWKYEVEKSETVGLKILRSNNQVGHWKHVLFAYILLKLLLAQTAQFIWYEWLLHIFYWKSVISFDGFLHFKD